MASRVTPITLDFETFAIEDRPEYPPKPVGLSIMYPGKQPKYLAWGHPEKNNTTIDAAKAELQDIYRSGAPLLHHNGKFDVDVATTHMGVRMPTWDRLHDTMFQLFLLHPHSNNLKLKPAAQQHLGMEPEERDAVADWLIDNHVIRKNQKGQAGAFIAYAPGDVVGRYANGDTRRTRKLHDLLYPQLDTGMLGAYHREQELMPILLENERLGMKIDLEKLREDVLTYEEVYERVEAWVRKTLKTPALNIDAGEELADALEKCGKAGGGFLLTEKSKQRSTSKDSLNQAISDKRLRSVLDYRSKLKTILGTFMRPWLRMAEHSGGWVNTSWNQVRQARGASKAAGARTGRLSSNPSLMNIPKDLAENEGYVHPTFLNVPELPEVRNYVIADDLDCVLLDRDYSQQELRILAHFEDGQLAAAYNANPKLDVHAYVGQEIQRVAQREIIRKYIKILNFLMVYGGGIDALMLKLGVSAQEAKTLKAFHSAALPDVKKLDEGTKARGKEPGGTIRTYGGRLYHVEPPRFNKDTGRNQTYEYKLLNYLIQGSASDHIKQSIINYHHIKKDGRFVLTVHDQNVACCPTKAVKSEMALLKEAMNSIPFDVPMLSEGDVGYRWNEMKPYDKLKD